MWGPNITTQVSSNFSSIWRRSTGAYTYWKRRDVNPQDIEVLTVHALTLAEQIDEVRWLNPAKALGWLLEKETRKPAARKASGAG
ncbi:hypothetical protein ABIG05_010694 [Bradyrhizobium japonicum]